jgi:hypothetical protein
MKTVPKEECRYQQLLRRHQILKQSLSQLGLTLQGTILRRIIARENPNQGGQIKHYGPYYQWTRKVAARTVIQNLTASQAKVYNQAIRENRKLEKTICEMRAISLKILELITEGVPKRVCRSSKKEPLT